MQNPLERKVETVKRLTEKGAVKVSFSSVLFFVRWTKKCVTSDEDNGKVTNAGGGKKKVENQNRRGRFGDLVGPILCVSCTMGHTTSKKQRVHFCTCSKCSS